MALMNATSSTPVLDLEIRQATATDLGAIRLLAASAFDREPIHRAALADLLYHRPPADPAMRLVATAGGALVGFAFGSLPERTGYLDAIAVEPMARRRGVATALLAALEQRLVRDDAQSLRIGGNTSFYAWPGVDLTYTAALSFFEQAGYQRAGLAQNMDVSLDRWTPGSAQQVLARHGSDAVIRRATPQDWPEIEAFILREFSEVWRHETHLAVHREIPSAFIATRDARVVGFGCHGVYRRDWFGPIGTDPRERGTGIGEALLRLCLDDLAEFGVAVAQINWIGPMSFYSRTVAARCGRQFVMFERPRPPADAPPGAEGAA